MGKSNSKNGNADKHGKAKGKGGENNPFFRTTALGSGGGSGGGNGGGAHGSPGQQQPALMSQVESEAEQRTKELLEGGAITQAEYDSIVAKTQQRR